MTDQDTIRFDVEGMTCASCAIRIERVLGRQDGVDSAVVNFAGQEARAVVDIAVITSQVDEGRRAVSLYSLEILDRYRRGIGCGYDIEKNRGCITQWLRIADFIDKTITTWHRDGWCVIE